MKTRATFRGVVLRDAAQRRAAAHPQGSRPVTDGLSRIRVGREVGGRGGKAVSVISGLPLEEAQLAELASRLKKLCGAGGTVRNGVIEIQGDHRQVLLEELRGRGWTVKLAGG